MKKQLLILMAMLLTASSLFAQKFELSVQANSGLFHFSGKSAAATSHVLQGSTTSPDPMNYTSNPYGNRNGFGYGGTLQGQFVTKAGFIWGLGAGYELLRSRVNIDRYTPLVYYTDLQLQTLTFIDPSFPVNGHTSLQNQSINLNPYIGYRFNFRKIKLDILPGLDFAFLSNTKDKGSVKDKDGKVYTVNRERSKSPNDIRLRAGAVASYGRFGLNASYAHGVTNYLSGYLSVTSPDQGNSGATFKANSELFRFGISYRIN